MNSYVKTTLIVLGGLAVAAVLILAGIFVGQRLNLWNGYRYDNFSQFFNGGMMGRSYNNNFRGYGMGQGMMGGYFNNQNSTGTVLSLEEAQSAFDNYIGNLENDDLEIKEIMVFDQNAYAIVTEKSSGMGAMELLVDPDTLSVFPEYGPNRMWNTKYSTMGNAGCGFSNVSNCGTGLYSDLSDTVNGNMPISMKEAAEIANEYLAQNIQGAEVVEEGYPFYGYYTFDYMQDGQMAGMLSINGTSGQVWLHTWHGQFIEEWELEEED